MIDWGHLSPVAPVQFLNRRVPLANFCPFCHKIVAPKDPDRVVINNTGTVCHGKCLERAAEKTKPRA